MTVLTHAQEVRLRVQGQVTDAATGQPLPYVTVGVEGSRTATSTNAAGRYWIALGPDQRELTFKGMGYSAVRRKIRGSRNQTVDVALKPSTNMLQEVVVTAKRHRERYRRRGNPAVELMREAIDRKEQNRPERHAPWQRGMYRKMTWAVNDFDLDLNRWVWRPLRFLEPYVDRYDPTCPRIGLTLREELKRQWMSADSVLGSPYALRMLGMEKKLDETGMAEQIEAVFEPVDIYDGDMQFMLEHFTGPLSPIAIGFYRFHIVDTVVLEGVRCIEVSFAPENKASRGFVGELWVTDDSARAIKQYTLTLNHDINLNFAEDVRITQIYHRDSAGRLLPGEGSTDLSLLLAKWLPHFHVHQDVVFGSYQFDSTHANRPFELRPVEGQDTFVVMRPPDVATADTIPAATGHIPARGSGKDSLTLAPWRWDELRPVPLVGKEESAQALLEKLQSMPLIQINLKILGAMMNGYVPTSREKDSSYFDIGSVFTMISHNAVEGDRLRLGGMTTSHLSARNYLYAYGAYGLEDRRMKGSMKFVHSFTPKISHPYEFPESTLTLEARYDLEEAGIVTGALDRDNVLMSSYESHGMEYVAMAGAKLRKEWANHLSVSCALTGRRSTPAIGLQYFRILADGSTEPVGEYADAECRMQLQYSPNERRSSSKLDHSTLARNARNTFKLTLTHSAGYLSGGFPYNKTELTAESRLWLSALGRIDLNLQAGAEWNRAPMAKLYFPPSSTALLIVDDCFRMMKPMEFVMDRYVCLFAEYNLRGMILNHVPLVRKLKLREVVSFALLQGALTDRNNPEFGGTGLYQFPTQTRPIGKAPYMEVGVGVHNILKVLRVDYVWRLNYLEGLPENRRGGIRVGMLIAM